MGVTISIQMIMPEQIFKFDPHHVYFTSDTHFGNENIIRFCGRPFRNAEEMNTELIRRWQETVPEDGIVFHLGDFAHGNAHLWNDILSVLPGRKFLILGNHDMKWSMAKGNNLFPCLRPNYMGHFEFVAQQMTIRIDGQTVMLNHNPFLCYGGSYRDVWQLFGHVHSGSASHTGLDHPRLRMLFPLQYDVGVDNNDFRPVSFVEVKEKIEKQVAAAKAVAGIRDEGTSPQGRKIVFLDSGIPIGPDEMAFLQATASDIIELEPNSSTSLKEVIAQRVSLLSGNIRFVYIGSLPLDDFRYIHVAPGAAITRSHVNAALRLL